MSLSAGARLGPYEIVEPIGSGGMGEVYRARDTRLDRTVAIKVLPERTAERPEVRQRFEREARAVSALNHPNICTLHDIGREGGVDYLVMEYLQGETLAERLKKGALPLDQTLRIAIQVADALDRAHRTGITHRDLKPGNIMLTKDGAKVLDFGLAKIRERGAGPVVSGGSAMETLTSPLTGEGAIVGTLQYMAPEQLEGKEADARSDIFAFGSILYEMAVGRRPFESKTQVGLIAKIMEHDPAPISTASRNAPPALDQLVRACLNKDPDERRQSMHDLLLDLQWMAQAGSRPDLAAPPAPARKIPARIWMLATAVLALATITLAIVYWLRPRPERPLMRLMVPPPDKTGFGYGLAISPDGKRLAFAGETADGQSLLWLRALDSLAAQSVPGTAGARFPFWSPDSRFIGFFAEGKLKKVDAAGGPVQVLCDVQDARGGSWNQDGVILFAPAINLPLQRIPAAGGVPVAATTIDAARKEYGHRWPHFLPDGRHYLCYSYCGRSADNAIAAGSLDSKNLRILTRADSAPAYSPPGFVLFVKGNILMAQPFDAARFSLAGDAFPVAQDVPAEGENGPMAFARFSLSRNGILVYVTGRRQTGQFTWFDRSGKPLGTVADPGSYQEPALSPDGNRLVFGSHDNQAGSNVWAIDLLRNVKSRFTFGPTIDNSAVWSPDGARVVFASNRGGAYDLYQKPATGTGTEELLFSSKFDKFPDDWSRDGRTLVFEVINPKNRYELWKLSLDSRTASPYLQTEFDTARAALSPDGHWIAYVSGETGRPEIYVQSFPVPAGGKYAISEAGGDQPRWRRDGRELFYLAQDLKLMAVPVAAGARFQAQATRALFQSRVPGIHLTYVRNNYAASADGQKFLVYTLSDAITSSPMIAVVNWTAGIH